MNNNEKLENGTGNEFDIVEIPTTLKKKKVVE